MQRADFEVGQPSAYLCVINNIEEELTNESNNIVRLLDRFRDQLG